MFANILCFRRREGKSKISTGRTRKRGNETPQYPTRRAQEPSSPRVHGLRFKVNSSSLESVREIKNPHDQTEAFSSPSSKTGTFELPLVDAVNEATVGRERTADQFLTVKEVSALLHLPVSWVYGRMRKRASDRLPGYRLGKYWRFRENEVLAWVESQRVDFYAT